MSKKPYRSATLPATMYHVRHRCGVTVHMMNNRIPAQNLARQEGLQVFEIDRTKGTAVQLP